MPGVAQELGGASTAGAATEVGGGSGAGAGAGDSFDINAAVSEIAEGLNFTGASDDDDAAGDGAAGAGGEPAAGTAPAQGAPATTPAAAAPEPGKDGAAPAAGTPSDGPADLTQPPKTWRKEVAAEWAALPESIRAEVHKRESDMYRGIEQYRGMADVGQQLKTVLTPYLPILQQANIDPFQQISGLMQAHATLALGNEDAKLDMFTKLVTDYKLPMAKLLARITNGALDGGEPFVDPAVKSLQERLERVDSRLSARELEQQREYQSKVQAEVRTFASDPANVHFEALADDISQLLRAKVCGTLKEAYDKALWANPQTRAKEIARIESDAASKRAKEAADAAAAARKANGANLRTKERSASPTAATGTMDDTLAEALANINARAH